MRLPSFCSLPTRRPQLPLLLAVLLLPALLFLAQRHAPFSMSSSFDRASTFRRFDYSDYNFDPNSQDHKNFCTALKDLSGFRNALEGSHPDDQISPASLKPRAQIIPASLLLESLALRRSSPASLPLDPTTQHTHPTLPFHPPPNHSVPHLIHQSWKSQDTPPLYQPMIDSWLETYPEARYVLWDDESNRKLVEVGYPELLPLYEALDGEIFRADLVRNLYMHAFGGIYSDLDSQAYRPLHPHFASLSSPSSTPDPIAFLGRMQTNSFESHSIPNAFMASSPGHPFWLEGPVFKALTAFEEGRLETSDPEHLTGPVALMESEDWWNVWGGSGKKGVVKVLDWSVAYPYSWDWRSEMEECVCWARSPFFNTRMCHALMPTAYVISFWKHSW